jgi:hypothetical protein
MGDRATTLAQVTSLPAGDGALPSVAATYVPGLLASIDNFPSPSAFCSGASATTHSSAR